MHADEDQDMRQRASQPSTRMIAAAFAVALLGLGAVFAVSLQGGVTMASLTVDPVAAGHLPLYTGLLSNIGVLVWWAGATACAVLGLILHRQGARDARPVLLSGAALAFLCLDDFFLLHEDVAPAIGLSSSAASASYVVAALVFAYVIRDYIRASRWTLFLFAVAFLGTSLAIDFANDLVNEGSTPGIEYLGEDGTKFIGIVLFVTFFVGSAAQRVMSLLDEPRPLPDIEVSGPEIAEPGVLAGSGATV